MGTSVPRTRQSGGRCFCAPRRRLLVLGRISGRAMAVWLAWERCAPPELPARISVRLFSCRYGGAQLRDETLHPRPLPFRTAEGAIILRLNLEIRASRLHCPPLRLFTA